MIKSFARIKPILPYHHVSVLNFLGECFLTRMFLLVYGQSIVRANGIKFFIKWFLRINIFFVWSSRVYYFAGLIIRNSLFSITGFIAELFPVCYYLIVMVLKEKSICNYFFHIQEQLSDLHEKTNRNRVLIRSIGPLFIILLIIMIIVMTDAYGVIDVPHYSLYMIQHVLLDDWVLSSCALYSLALVGYFIWFDYQIRLFKRKYVMNSKISYGETLKHLQKLEQFHIDFESVFSFMPPLWLGFNWCQATVYLIGVIFGPMKELFHIATFVWSTSMQVVAFCTIGLAIFINDKVSSKFAQVLPALELKMDKSQTYLIVKMDKIVHLKFTAWNFCFLEKSLIFRYLASLITFSVLTLQMDYSTNHVLNHGSPHNVSSSI